MAKFNMDRIRKIHLLGIGGCGMSGIAAILKQMGYQVSGSDSREGPNTIRLRDLGVKVFIGHEADHVRGVDLVIYSSAVTVRNPERREAKAKEIPIIKRAEMLAWILEQSQLKIAVAGTHGKTTTTAMLSKVFDFCQLTPTYLIGCDMDYVEGNAKLGSGRFAIAEADESDSSFLYYSPTVAVITNIEPDHMEQFGSIKVLQETFEKFARGVDEAGFIVLDGSNQKNQELMSKVDRRFITYGLEGDVQYTAKNLHFDQFNSSFNLVRSGEDLGQVHLSVPGWQNVVNSLPVFAIGFEYGLDFASIAAALQTFVGARRRFQTIGEIGNILVIDDYAHHPTEIKATLSAAKLGWPERRIICVFQPHRFTRTVLLKKEFGEAFGDADKIVITDIYAASEKPIPGVSGQTIVDNIKNKEVEYIPRKEMINDYLLSELKEGDIVLTLGAGDIYTVGKELLTRLKMRQDGNKEK